MANTTTIKNELLNDKNISIYGLIDSRNNKVIYIGKTGSSLRERLWRHINDTRGNSAKVKWINECNSNNIEVKIVLLEVVSTYNSENEEIKWINHYGIDNLLNENKGGGGSHSSRHYNDIFKFRIYLERNYSKNSVNSYITSVNSFLKYFNEIKRPKEISSLMISKYLSTLSTNTRKTTESALKLFYSHIIMQPNKLNKIRDYSQIEPDNRNLYPCQ